MLTNIVLFPKNTFYYITPELEGMLTLQSCIGRETSAQFFLEFDFMECLETFFSALGVRYV